ncbi:MAG: hypothetical protein NTX61_00845 [Bacteroidetes bacterium]|nr:hypothetical protein [Bacteroidota bacterium]
MDIRTITIIGGFGKDGSKENVDRFDLCLGDIVSFVGPKKEMYAAVAS